MNKFLYSIVLVLSFQSIIGQRYERYDILNVHAGLSSNYVDCIFRDSRGFVWIGTWDGLNRYDGFNVVQYKSDTDSSSLIGNWVFKIFEDKQNNLWICTNNGLSKYDYELNRFENKKELSFISVKAITQSKNNHLWISTINGLLEYDYLNDVIINQYFVRDTSNSSNYAELSDLTFDKDENLWIGTHRDGLLKFDISKDTTIHYNFKPSTNQTISNKIKTICFDGSGHLWLGSFDNGVAIFDTTSKTFDYKFFEKGNTHSIGSNAVSHINTDSEGTVWVSCQNGYLNRYRAETNDFIRYEYNSYLANSLPAKSVSYLFQDNLGIYWIGTHGYGVAQRNPIKNNYSLYRVLPNAENTLPNNKITAFVEMPDSSVIVGTDGGGISIFNRKNELFSNYSIENGLASNSITDISLGVNNEVWIATWNGGISMFDYDTKEITSYVNDPHDKWSLNYNNIKGLYYFNDTVWIATHGEGIAFFNTIHKKFTSYSSNSPMPFDLKIPQWANDFYVDSKNRYWMPTYNGLYCYDGSTLKSFANNNETPTALSSNQVISVLEDSNGTIWLLSDNGLDMYSEEKDRFQPCNTNWHLPQSIKAIVEDDNKNIWISSTSEIFCFSLQDYSIKKYSPAEGLPLNDFLYKSAYKLQDGTLLFGGTNGFVCFNPASFETINEKPAVGFIDLFVNGHQQIPGELGSLLRKSIILTDTIQYKYSKNIIEFQIVAFNTTIPEEINYAYTIEGFNAAWIQLDKSRKVILPSLQPGTYNLKIKAFSSSNLSNSSIKGLHIIVLPNWWQTWWFKSLISLFVILFIIAIFILRFKNLQKRNRVLERKVSSRTRELIQVNEALKEQQDITHSKNKQLNAALTSKNQLISILAHDFKNPLNGILGVSELLNKQTDVLSSLKTKKYVQLISNSAQSLSNQMIKVLDWIQSQDANFEAVPVEINIEVILDDVLALEAANIEKKEISIVRDSGSLHNALVDSKMAHMVFRNFLTNAMKFTPRKGTIAIETTETDKYITTSFTDSGSGISNDLIEKILNSSDAITSQQGTEKEKGTGLGLRLCKQFIEKNKGILLVENIKDTGARFSVSFPKGNEITSKPLEEIELEIESESRLEKANEKPEKRHTVLIIDDNEEILETISENLINSYAILKAEKGEDGIEMAKKNIPDLIICDINLPNTSGIELCSMLKKFPLTSHIPILLISSHTEEEIKNNAFKAGATDFIEKPFNSFYLKSKVNGILSYQQDVARHVAIHSNSFSPEDFDDVTIKKTIEFINNNVLDTKLNTGIVATAVGINRTQLWRIFKQKTDKSLSEYIREIKLQKAASMLMTGKYRVNEIAYIVGFSDSRYFSKIFTNEFGITPSEYANKFKK